MANESQIQDPIIGLKNKCRKCGRKYWFYENYRGHFALVHILGLNP